MEDIDDDFGDLYADVELRVSSSVNAIQQSITELVRAKDEISGEEEEKNVDSVADCGAKEVLNSEVNGEEAVSLDSGSDSEEDLNIVLNDDGGGGGGCRFAVGLRNGGYEDEEVEVEEETGGPVGGLEGNALGKNQKWRNQPQGQVADELDPSLDGRERGNGGHNSQYPQYKFIRSHRVEFSNNSNANGSVVLDFNTSASIKGDMEDNGFGQRMGHQLMGAQNRQNFSLPRARTILDVNIDSFEWKPWRHPVADVTDFFNFGFNEDSWKTYCNHLDQYRQQTRMLSRVPAYGFLNSKETCEAGYGCEAQEALDELVAQTGHETEISSALGTSSRTHKQLEMPIGRPIQVEDSNGERQPSMDVRRPLDRDSVVIQIAMQDLKEDSSGSAKVELGCVGSPVQELPDIGDSADDAREISCFSGASEDELSLEELEGHDEGMSSPVTKRCTEETTACRLSTNSDAHGIAQISGIDVLDPRKVTVYDSEGTSEAMETSNITKRRVVRSTSDTAISILETESCHGEQSQQIPSSSYSGSHGQAIDNDTSFDQEKYGNLGKESSPNLVGKLDRYDSHDSKNSRSGRAKRKSSHCNYSTTHRSPIPELAKHWKDKDASPMSDIDGFMGVHHQTVLHGKQKERLNNFDSYYQEDTCDYRESKRSFNHYGGRFCDYKTDGYTRNPHSKQYQKFVTESNQYCNRDWDEGEYFIERRKGRGSHEEIERDWYQHERQLPVHGMRAFSRNNSSWLTSNHDSHVESGRGNRWRGREDELRLRDRMRNDNYSRNDDYLAEYSDDDGYIQDRFERPVPYNDTGTDYSDHGYGSYSPYGRREIKSPGISNRRFDIPSPELDNMWDRDDVYQSLRCRDHRSLSSHSYKEVATADNQRWRRSISPRNVHERHISHREHIWNDGWRDGGSADAFDTQKRVNYPDELPLGRRHHFTNDVFTSRSRDDKFFDHGTSYDYESTSRCKSFDDRHGGTLMGDKQLVHGRCKLIREENDGNRKDRRSNIISRTNHELTKPRGSNSVDSFSVNGEGKLAGRLSVSFNDLEEETTLKGSDETRTSNLEVKSSQQIEAAATDIEEGQIIVTEETNAKVVNKNTSLLEAMARMEKRRERFKEPILTKKDSDKTDKPVVVETCVETAEAKQQRPARKRRWGGN